MTAVYWMDTEQFRLKEFFHAGLERMPAARAQKIASIKNEPAKMLSLAAGILLDYGLRQRGLRYSELTVEEGAHGKPYITGKDAPCFNLSHSGTRAVCAIADTEVGVDIEQIRKRDLRVSLIRKVCTEAEREYLWSIDSDDRQKEQFCRLWTVKESVMKQSGMGFTMMPGTIKAEKAFEQDTFVCGGRTVCIYREQDYYISVCGTEEVSEGPRQIGINEYL